MAVDKDSPVPLYEQIYLTLRDKIESGQYLPGSRLPSQKELADEHGVSMVTLRQAVEQLEAEGLIMTKQGKGTFVVDSKVVQSLGKLRSLTEVLLTSGFSPSVEVDVFGFRPAPDTVAKELHLPPGSNVLEIRRRHLVENEPLAYAIIYLPESIGSCMTREDVQQFPIYTIYEQKLKIRLGRAAQSIRAVGANRSVAQALGIPLGTPTLSAQWVTSDTTGVPVEWINIFYRADLYKFVVEVERNGWGELPIVAATFSQPSGPGQPDPDRT